MYLIIAMSFWPLLSDHIMETTYLYLSHDPHAEVNPLVYVEKDSKGQKHRRQEGDDGSNALVMILRVLILDDDDLLDEEN